MFFLFKKLNDWLSKSIEYRIQFYALLLAVIIITIFSLFFYTSLKYVLTLNVKDNLNHELDLSSKTLNIILSTISQDVNTLSKSSIVSNGLFDSAGRESYLKPYFRDYKNHFNIPTNLILVDFMGEPVISSSLIDLAHYKVDLEVQEALKDENKGVAKVIGDKIEREILLIKPVVFKRTGHTEGAIVAKIKLENIKEEVQKVVNKNYVITIFSQEEFNNHKLNSNKYFISNQKIITINKYFPNFRFLLEIKINKDIAFANLYLINISFILATLIIFILIFFVTGKIAKTIVTPVVKLTKSAKEISESGEAKVKIDIDSNDEIGELSKIFNLMLKKLDVSYEAKARNEKLLIQQSKMAEMGEMMGAIAHQWRQPLNALGLIIQKVKFLYQRGKLGEDEILDIQNRAMKQINFMSKTIDDFRDFFKPNKEKEEFSIYDAIFDVINILSAQLKVHNISVALPEFKEIKVLGYKNEFKQVILNILNNSKDAILEKQKKEDINFNGEIIINIIEMNKYLTINIEDNAGGIPLEIIDKIFNPYFTTKEQGEGTGIGLYMSKTIIENSMGGSLKVLNKNSGACFSINLKVNS